MKEEVPVRLANLAAEMDYLPRGLVDQPLFGEIRDAYRESFRVSS